MPPFFSRRASKQDKPKETQTGEKALPAPPRASSFNFRSSRNKEKDAPAAALNEKQGNGSTRSLVPRGNGIEHEVHFADTQQLEDGKKEGPSSSGISTRPASFHLRPRSTSPSKSARHVGAGPGPSTPDVSVSVRSSIHTGYEQSIDADAGQGHYVPVQASWSSMAEDDLINNLGPRERGRQEVLWEIVSSEERYVQDLVKLVDTFTSNLLPASTTTPTLTLDDPIASLMRTLSPGSSLSASPAAGSPIHSQSHQTSPALPIAAQFARSQQGSLFDDPTSPIAFSSTGLPSDARLDAYQKLTNGRPGAGSSTSINAPVAAGLGLGGGSVRPGMTSRASLPGPAPPRRQGSFTGSVRNSSAHSTIGAGVDLPEELKKVLETIANGILPGHVKLAAALRRRYENQYPLVRSLADVFTAHSAILREYATYVLHLERALETIDTSQLAYQSTSKRLSYTRNREKALVELGKTLWGLDQLAASRAETGLAISLSKPFQRLLKYPLLFQNLLFNTDPSLKEYEATLAMVDEVEAIVRGIEDEKTSQEERNKARDGWVRIEGMDTKELMMPKPTRLLVSETKAMSDMPDVQTISKSRNRLSDMLKKQDPVEYWVVKFSDVTLLCEKTGVTHLPLTGTGQLAGMDSKARKRASMQRSQSIRARNLYKFCKVLEWNERNVSGPTAPPRTTSLAASAATSGASLARIAQSPPTTPQKTPAAAAGLAANGSNTTPVTTPLRIPLKTNDGPSNTPSSGRRPVDTDASTVISDRQSVMSFAFKGGDQLKPARVRPRPMSTQSRSAGGATPSPSISGKGGNKDMNGKSAIGTSRPASYGARAPGGHVQGKAAAAKFAHRLRPIEGLDTDVPDGSTRQGEPGLVGAAGNGHTHANAPKTAGQRSVSVRSSLPPAMRHVEVPPHHRPTNTQGAIAEERSARMSTPPAVSSRLLAPTAASAAKDVRREGDASVSSRRTTPRGRGGMI